MNAPPRWASNLPSKAKERMGKIKVFPAPEYSSKQSSDPVVPRPTHGHFPRPQQVRQNRGADQPHPGAVSRRLQEDLHLQSFNCDRRRLGPRQKVHRAGPTEQEQAYWEDWDEAALRGIIQRQRKITETSKKMEMKKLC